MSGPRGGVDERWDVLIIGSGAAGSAAAYETASRGLSTLVVESQDSLGGAAGLSGGGCAVAGTPLQAEQGIDDSIELALRDWARWGGPGADLIWARRYLDRAVPDVYEWVQDMGVEWVRLLPQEGNSVPRWHAPAGGGPRLMAALRERMAALPVQWLTRASATRLHVEGGRVRATDVQTQDGLRTFEAGAVVVATGGFTGSDEALRHHLPSRYRGIRVLSGGAPGATGTGHRMMQEIGAAVIGLDRVWTYPYSTVDIRTESADRGLAVRGLRNVIWVNADGARFHDESRNGGATGTPALLAQRGHTCWAVFDAEDARNLTLSDPAFGSDDAPDRQAITDYLEATPYAHSATSIRALAERCGLPADALTQSVETFNHWVVEQRTVDPQHGRELAGLGPIRTAPFHAVQFFPMARKSLGGVVTDASCRVRLTDGSVLRNLFAAGELSGMAGGCINGEAALEGTMLGPSLFSGRVAGRAAASAVVVAARADTFR